MEKEKLFIKGFVKRDIMPIKQENYKKIRRHFIRLLGGQCCFCGSTEKLEFDHIIPVSKGGSNTANNIELLCRKCNRSKHARIE